jgi:hypothetical protein
VIKAMKTIYADFNAMTEAGHVCLTTLGSQEDVTRAGLRVGDWAWLSDGELVVGAQLAIDDRYGLVGVPDWDTLAHLDEEGADNHERVHAALHPLLTREPLRMEDEPRILELLIQLDHAAPPHLREANPGILASRRALALRNMGKLGLALLEIREARRAVPDDVVALFVYLDLLGQEDLHSAVSEAASIAQSPDVSALVLSVCINILAIQAQQASEDQFEAVAQQVLALCRRFDEASDLDQAGPSLVALSFVNRGFIHLRAGRVTQARNAFDRAQQIYPEGPMISELSGLQTYDRHAREVASVVRTIADRWFPTSPVAA